MKIDLLKYRGILFLRTNLLGRILRKMKIIEPIDFRILIMDLLPKQIWRRGHNSWVCDIGGERLIVQQIARENYLIIFNRTTISAQIKTLDAAKDAIVKYYAQWIIKHLDNNKINKHFEYAIEDEIIGAD